MRAFKTVVPVLQWVAVAALAVLVPSCGKSGGSDPAAAGDETRPGGEVTVSDASANAFGHPAPTLDLVGIDSFSLGNSFFKNAWTVAPASAAGRDGLGPFHNANSCSACHLDDGRGAPPAAPTDDFVSLLLRISIPGASPNGGPNPDPSYGDQIQHHSLSGIDPEATPRVSYVEAPGTYPDTTPYSLRVPTYSIDTPNYGALPPGLMVSPRIGSQVFGMGLLVNIPDSRLLELADPADANGDGISGRVNLVHDVASNTTKIGRLGWKANQPGVAQQAAGAFLGDIGISSPLFPAQNITPAQTAAALLPDGGTPEIGTIEFNAVVFYLKTLAVPARRAPGNPQVLAGKALFTAAGCVKCHVPSHTTGVDPDIPQLSNQVIFPYTDLLLHDLGPGLADGRSDFLATGTEWRTPPLWGIGLIPTVNGHSFLLHDGRARNVEEAVLWHDGEAAAARDFFKNLPAADRAALLAFVNDL